MAIFSQLFAMPLLLSAVPTGTLVWPALFIYLGWLTMTALLGSLLGILRESTAEHAAHVAPLYGPEHDMPLPHAA